MSSTLVEPSADDTASPKKSGLGGLLGRLKPARLGKKKLIILGLALVVLLAIGGGAAALVLKQRADAAAAAAAEAGDEEDDEDAAADDDGGASSTASRDRSKPPVFVALDAFTVNLADKEAERFAQVGISLEITEPKFADELRTYMPAIRNNMLMLLAHKTSVELLDRAGKEKLAREVGRETLSAMDLEPADPGGRTAGGDDSPIRRVHFSSFIIQ